MRKQWEERRELRRTVQRGMTANKESSSGGRCAVAGMPPFRNLTKWCAQKKRTSLPSFTLSFHLSSWNASNATLPPCFLERRFESKTTTRPMTPVYSNLKRKKERKEALLMISVSKNVSFSVLIFQSHQLTQCGEKRQSTEMS